MTSFADLQQKNNELYDRLRARMFDFKRDEQSKKAFHREVEDFLAQVQSAGPTAKTIDEYEWLVQTTVNWHSALATVLGIPTDVVRVEPPQRLEGRAARLETTSVASQFQRLPIDLVIQVSRAALTDNEQSNSQAQWTDYIDQLTHLGYEVNRDNEQYVRAIFETSKKMFDLDRSYDYMRRVLFLSEKFVKSQKGQWDHVLWLGFLMELEQKGITTSDQTVCYLGDILEAFKGLYFSLQETRHIQESMDNIAEYTVDFLRDQKVAWDRGDWETLVQRAQDTGVRINQESRRYMENLAEAGKRLFFAQLGIKE